VKPEIDCFYFANNGRLSDSSTKAIAGMGIPMGIDKYHLQNRAYHQYVPLIHNRVLPFQIGIATGSFHNLRF
jgi:hypothetical protein